MVYNLMSRIFSNYIDNRKPNRVTSYFGDLFWSHIHNRKHNHPLKRLESFATNHELADLKPHLTGIRDLIWWLLALIGYIPV